jgi:hypothetical protein
MFNEEQRDHMRYLAEMAKQGKTCHCGWYVKGKDASQEQFCQGYQKYHYAPGKLGVPVGPKLPCNVAEQTDES